MGMTEDERFSNIVFVVNSLNNMVRETNKKTFYLTNSKEIIEIIDKLWPALNKCSPLKGYTHQFDYNHGIYEYNIVQVAFEKILRETNNDYPPVRNNRSNENWLYDIWHEVSLLDYEDNFILKVFKKTERYFESVNRYKDEFSNNFEILSDLFSKIQGLCFDSFKEQDCFVKQWMLSHILKIIIPYDDKKDPIYLFAKDHGFQYQIPKDREIDIKVIQGIFEDCRKKYHNNKTLSTYKRAEYIIKICKINGSAIGSGLFTKALGLNNKDKEKLDRMIASKIKRENKLKKLDSHDVLYCNITNERLK